MSGASAASEINAEGCCVSDRSGYDYGSAKDGRLRKRQPPPGGGRVTSKPIAWITAKEIRSVGFFRFINSFGSQKRPGF
jgi:hypothetical protein